MAIEINDSVRDSLVDLILQEISDLANEVKAEDFEIEDLIESVFDIVGPAIALLIPGTFDDAFVIGLTEKLKEQAIAKLVRDVEELREDAQKLQEKSEKLLADAEAAAGAGRDAKARRLRKRAARRAARALELLARAAEMDGTAPVE